MGIGFKREKKGRCGPNSRMNSGKKLTKKVAEHLTLFLRRTNPQEGPHLVVAGGGFVNVLSKGKEMDALHHLR